MTAAESIQGGDSGEFTSIALNGGVPHPPGYPLYVFLSNVFSSFVSLSVQPCLAVSLFSTFCGVATVLVLYVALFNWGIQSLVAALASLLFGLSPLFWRLAGVPEVFTLNTLIAVALIWASGYRNTPRGIVRAGLLGLFLGLGLSNHHTIILLFPIFMVGVIHAFKERRQAWWLLAMVTVLGLTAGLTPYLYFFSIGQSDVWVWGGSFGWVELWEHFTRAAYGTFRLGITEDNPGLLVNPFAYLIHLARSFSFFVLVGLLGLVYLLRHLFFSIWAALGGQLINWTREPRRSLQAAGICVSLVFCGAFLAMMNLNPEGISQRIIERFYVLPDVVFVLVCAMGLDLLLRSWSQIGRYLRHLGVGMCCVLITFSYQEANWRDNFAVEDYILNALDTTEPGSVILGSGDMNLFGFLAASDVYEHRGDVTYIDVVLIRNQWYYERLQRRLPHLDVPINFDIPQSMRGSQVADVLEDLLPRHHVYVIGPDVAEILEIAQRRLGVQSYPIGPLVHVVGPGELMPNPIELERLNRELFARFRFRGSHPVDTTSWGGLAHEEYARTWRLLAEAFEHFNLHQQANLMWDLATYFGPHR